MSMSKLCGQQDHCTSEACRNDNYCKITQSLIVLKNCLEDFTDRWVREFHNEILTRVCSRSKPAGQRNTSHQTLKLCKSCTNKEVEYLSGKKWTVKCFSNICNVWLDIILDYYACTSVPKIFRKNLEPQRWFMEPWEVAKVFLPQGCKDITKAKHADVAAILTLMTKCVYITNYFQRTNLIEEVLEIRHNHAHPTTLTISYGEMKRDTDKIIELLRSLVSDKLTPTETDDIRHSIATIEKLQVTDGDSVIKGIETTQQEQGERISVLEDNQKSKTDIPSAITKEEEQEVKRFLCFHYESTILWIPNPLENDNIGIECINVDQESRVVRESSGRREGLKNKEDDPSNMPLKDIFDTDNSKCEKIYITADALGGKTMYCRNIVKLWCDIQNNCCTNNVYDSESYSDPKTTIGVSEHKRKRKTMGNITNVKRSRRDDDIEILSRFDFVFYIDLNEYSPENSVTETIQSQILQVYLFNTGKHVNAIDLMKSGRCLVIFDDLTGPMGDIPYALNPAITNNVFLTLIRTSNFDELGLKSSECDKHIELCGLNEQSASRLCSNVMKTLDGSRDCEKKEQEFFKELNQKGIDHFSTIPIVLIHLVIRWCKACGLGDSPVQVYLSILNLLLKKSLNKIPGKAKIEPKDEQPERPVAKCLLGYTVCHDNQHIIKSLGKIAYRRLFEQRSVFRSSEAYKYGVGHEEFKLCLKSGIISQAKVQTTSETKLKFCNEKIEALLATIFIASCNDSHSFVKSVGDYCSTLQSCLEMSQVWLFLAEIRPDIAGPLVKHLVNILRSDEQVQTEGIQLQIKMRQYIDDRVIDDGNYLT